MCTTRTARTRCCGCSGRTRRGTPADGWAITGITDDPVLAENHLWPDGGPIDPVAWPELHAYAARLGWQTDAAGHFLLPDLRGKYLVGADSRDPDFAAGKESGEKTHTLTKAELPNVSIGLGQQ